MVVQADDLVGVWRLVTCEGRSSHGKSFLPYGDKPVGKLIYTASGHMSVILMAGDRKGFQSEDVSRASDSEVSAAFRSFDAYSGRWSFNPDKQDVLHTIEAGRVPQWVDRTHRRSVQMRDGMLTLVTEEFSMAGDQWRVFVVWSQESHQ
jgi:hypothetical protein